jgi:hypothetical protein
VAGPLVPAQIAAGTKGSRPKARFPLVVGSGAVGIANADDLEMPSRRLFSFLSSKKSIKKTKFSFSLIFLFFEFLKSI